jgi:hypothetical protein
VSATLVIAVREIRERRFLLLTALLLGILPFGWGLVPSLPAPDALDARILTGLLLGLAFPSGVALAVGASVVSREMAERRLGFYFARPISAFSLWSGKFLGAVVLVLLSVLLVAGPVAAASGAAAEFLAGRVPFPLLVLAPGLFLFIAVAHVFASGYRSRSPFFILDVGLALGACGTVGAVMSTMAYAGAADVFGRALPWLVGVLAAALLLAPAVQLGVGRVDARRGSRALSMAVWVLTGAVLVGFFLWSRSVLNVTPQEAGGVGYGVWAAPTRGSAVLFTGAARERGSEVLPGHPGGYLPGFVMDGASGAYARFSAQRMTVPVFTSDGRRAFWVAPPPEPFHADGPALVVARFEGGRPTVSEVELSDVGDDALAIAIDGIGSRIVLAGPSWVALADASTARILARAQAPRVIAASFRSDGTLRLLEGPAVAKGSGGFALADWDPVRGSLTERWRHPAEGPSGLLAVHGDEAFVSINGRDGALIDLESGARIAVETPWAKSDPTVRFGTGTPMFGVAAQFLSNGQLAFAGKGEMRLVGAHETRIVPMGEGASVWALAETSPGELAVGLWGPSGRPRTVFLDAATGAVRREEKGLIPATPRYAFLAPGGRAPEAGSFASRLFIDQEGALIERRADGTRRVVVRPPE